MFMATGLTSDYWGIINYKFLITTSMKKFFLIASAFAMSLCASAQLDPKSIDLDDTFDFLADLPPLPSAPPHLTPSAPSYIGVVDSYSEIVDDMFELYGRKVQWAFVDRPSFSPEYAVKCIGISGQPYLVAVTASKNIWYNSRPNVEVIGDTLQVSMEISRPASAQHTESTAEQIVTERKLLKSRMADMAGKIIRAEISRDPTRFIASTMITAITVAISRL